MKSTYYSAAWTDSGFLLGCSHEHETILEADSCIACAGGYVVGVENGVMRSLTAEEEVASVWCGCAVHSCCFSAPTLMNAVRESLPALGEVETFVERVLRLLDAYGFDLHAEAISDAKNGSISDSTSESNRQMSMVDPAFMARLILSRLSELEIGQLERMCDGRFRNALSNAGISSSHILSS